MSTRYIMIIAGAASLTFLSACTSSTSSPTQSKPAAGGSVVSMQGSTLVAPNGHTIYENTLDTSKSIKCVGTCQTLWPPVPGPARAGSGLTAADLGTITRPDGSVQATLNGHPLYEFSGDKAAGDKSGEGIADGGGAWHTATVTGTPASPAPSMSSSSSGGGAYTY
ncbi:MAG: COG4315 family predicted lipoprotein [Jatrophihabitantaceae bacterium]